LALSRRAGKSSGWLPSPWGGPNRCRTGVLAVFPGVPIGEHLARHREGNRTAGRFGCGFAARENLVAWRLGGSGF